MDLFGELTRLLAELSQRRAEYAVCGAVALAIHGVPRATKDIDVLVRDDQLQTVKEAARAAGFTLESLPMTFSSTGVTVHLLSKIVDGQPLMLDLLVVSESLEAVWQSRQVVPWSEGEVVVVSRPGLITLKLAANRPQDIADVQRLQELDRD